MERHFAFGRKGNNSFNITWVMGEIGDLLYMKIIK